MPETSLEQKVDHLLAIEAIKQLKYLYCRYCDSGYDADGVASLFVEDGVWDGGELFGRYEGRETIRKNFATFATNTPFAAHMVVNPIITVNGDSAQGRWWLWEPIAVKRQDGAVQGRWLNAEYVDDYVRRDGEWKFQITRILAKFYAGSGVDWAKHLRVDSAALQV